MAEPGPNTDGTSTGASPFTAEQLAMITELVRAGVVAGLAPSHGPAAMDGGPPDAGGGATATPAVPPDQGKLFASVRAGMYQLTDEANY